MKKLVHSILALILCAIIIVGATMALFTDNIVVNNHLSAGNLEVGLHRVSYQEFSIDANGLMSNKAQNTDRIDLNKDASVLFNISNAVPSSLYQATIEVTNLGTTAFNYGMRILWQANDNPDDNDEVFASQIRITVTGSKIQNETNSVSFMLSEVSSVTDISLGYMLKGADPETFTVKAEFVNSDSNNAAMLASIIFDVQVFAVQKVSA